jgi:hypothetical protein
MKSKTVTIDGIVENEDGSATLNFSVEDEELKETLVSNGLTYRLLLTVYDLTEEEAVEALVLYSKQKARDKAVEESLSEYGSWEYWHEGSTQ